MTLLKRLFRGKDLSDIVEATKTVKVCGVRFKIRKLDVTKHAEGFKVLMTHFQTYEDKSMQEKSKTSVDLDKIKAIYTDIFLGAVVHPKLTRNDGEPGQYVGALFCDWNFCHDLYSAIMEYTNGKKKMKSRQLR